MPSENLCHPRHHKRGGPRQRSWWSVSEVSRENRSSGATGRKSRLSATAEAGRLCPPGPMAAHGHVNGWREAPGWSEAEGLWRQQPTCHLVQQKGPRGHSGTESPQMGRVPLKGAVAKLTGVEKSCDRRKHVA